MSQRQLALRMSVPRTYVSKIENEKATPTLSSLERLARALEVSVPMLLSGGERNRQEESRELMEDSIRLRGASLHLAVKRDADVEHSGTSSRFDCTASPDAPDPRLYDFYPGTHQLDSRSLSWLRLFSFPVAVCSLLSEECTFLHILKRRLAARTQLLAHSTNFGPVVAVFP